MPNQNTAATAGRARLRRDNQQWLLDYLIKETGKVFHFQPDGRGNLPRSVRSHAMISKHLGRQAQTLEALAQAEAAVGHRDSALELYFEAAMDYMGAQHPIFKLNDEKRFLYAGLRRCYDQICELSPYRIERVDVPWNGTTVSGYLHLCPGAAPAPCVFFATGCDVTCEWWPHPRTNQALQRGMHVFSFDGPGQGASNMREIKLTADNWEQAASAALDYLVQRPEIDAERIGLYGVGYGGFWAMRFAATDHRIRAVATSSTYTDKYHLMSEDSPRYKQLFAFLTQSPSEEELDAVLEQMALEGYMEKISCPVLMLSGEFDPRDPMDEVYELFDQIRAPAELWVFADQFHPLSFGAGGQDLVRCIVMDWLKDRFDGKEMSNAGQVLYIEGKSGPNSPTIARKRKWYEA